MPISNISVQNFCYQISFCFNQSMVEGIRGFLKKRYFEECRIWDLLENTDTKKRILQQLSTLADVEFIRQKNLNHATLTKILEILGKSSSKTTEIYTHLSNKMIGSIRSPF